MDNSPIAHRPRLDPLVADFAPGTNLIQVAALRRQLTELLGCRVDIVSSAALEGRFGETVSTEMVPL